MGLDWRTLDLSDYLEALEAHNAANNPDAKPDLPDRSEELARVMEARGGGNAGVAAPVASPPSSGA